jgi:2-polyprenyl-6-methoxyphenol hydroxylase-like FAD-dependent oxidoreductase
MSPVGGVGINLAVQDAVATANLLAEKLRRGELKDEDLDAVRRRRFRPMSVIQHFQVAVHNRILKPMVAGERHSIAAPFAVKMLDATPWLRRWPAQVLGVGLRPEHVESPLHQPQA